MEGICFSYSLKHGFGVSNRNKKKIKKSMAATKPCPKKQRKKDRHKI